MIKEYYVMAAFVWISLFCFFTLAAMAPAADNSAMNKKDYIFGEKNADQQGKSLKDIEITREIRQKIVQDQNLSIYAKNIKVITNNGAVTLIGPVRSQTEVKSLMEKAHSVTGVSTIINRIDVTQK